MAATALGMVECKGLVAALEGADAGVKAASVDLIDIDYAGSGYAAIKFVGEVADVQAAVDAACQAARRVGEVISTNIIARLDEQTQTIRDAEPGWSGNSQSWDMLVNRLHRDVPSPPAARPRKKK